jgi:putative tricarboxylic transport membrane protein
MMQLNYKDIAAGAIFVALGLAFALSAIVGLRMGSGLNMGPGYFPRALGFILVGLGAIIMLGAINKPESRIGKVSWRGVVLITASLFYFAFGVRTLGMVPALAGCIILACLASDRITLLRAVLISAALTSFATVLFVYALGLPISLIGPWLGGY